MECPTNGDTLMARIDSSNRVTLAAMERASLTHEVRSCRVHAPQYDEIFARLL